MQKLWGRTSSSNVMKVLWTLEELGLDYERIDAGGAFGRTREPEYRAMNPMGLVPTWQEDDGWSVWESNTIARYLCNAHAPDGTLYPSGPRPRAEVETWMDWILGHLVNPMVVIFFTHVRLKENERDWNAEKKAREDCARLWKIVDARVANQPFMCGQAVTLADVALGCWVHRWFSLPIERPDLPNLARYYETLKTRPGFVKHVALPLE
ncbi:glutathione S-transferase family protein [Roseomonas terrae]|jgi:glutathione S-transferase|uniref:Glutathione S-transferase family protein n=1 Tax=Neoroseomonas terrae TaxID=424799 RepID=A0ABS5EBU7_9PROT|nr:glutathione S-transferase family protein [Neoroseomonas terrae]MBR0648499.1 glutathione S-transferase family protein [Neoroseomonas terrae]